MRTRINPFSVTKATEFTDREINDYFVNFNPVDAKTVKPILNPEEFLPKYIIGGKGCGKTHLLRYFSFPLQRIRYCDNLRRLLTEDRYIGLYSLFSGLTSSRFTGKKIDDEVWASVFEYYFELYICEKLITTCQEIFGLLSIDTSVEASIVQQAKLLFTTPGEMETLAQLNAFIAHLRRKIDGQVLNAAFTRSLDVEDVKVLFSPGDLLFGLPALFAEGLPEFKSVKFIYIFDEYEKFFEWQKQFVNSLVAEKRLPVTFWIGARRYGYTTRSTTSGEEMKSGSEFQEVDLDELIRRDPELYGEFANRLFVTRIGHVPGGRVLRDDVQQRLAERFRGKYEQYDEQSLIGKITDQNSHRVYKHISELRKKVDKFLGDKASLDVNKIVEDLRADTADNPLEQKYKLYRFYSLWSREGSSNLVALAHRVREEYERFINGTDNSVFPDLKEKRKKDLLAQLLKDNDLKNTEYSGVSQFIEISHGNPRSFLLILKKSVEFAQIRGEKPLTIRGRISLDAQSLAVYDTAKWFFQDAEVIGEKGRHMYKALKHLTDYLVQERFCDKPTETTPSAFYVKEEDLSPNAFDCLELLKVHSMIIEDDKGRRGKTSGRRQRKFQINRTMAPFWNLPVVLRGTVSLNPELTEAIFNCEEFEKFGPLYEKRRRQLNAPFLGMKSSKDKVDQRHLF